MKFNNLSADHRSLFEKHLRLRSRSLSAYAFENIYLWRSLYDIFWCIIDGSLCVFFRDKLGCFLFLPPLGHRRSHKALNAVWKVLDEKNSCRDGARIENVEEQDRAWFIRAGCRVRRATGDYLCARRALAALRGNAYKSKRSQFNSFKRRYCYTYRPLRLKDISACRTLLEDWQKSRLPAGRSDMYRGLLQDSVRSCTWLLRHWRDAAYTGRVVEVEGRVRAFSFGYALSRNTFCILYEVADLNIKGLAQAVFRHFCEELVSYEFINVMDDSGLDNLKRVKLSYRPVRFIPAYNVTRIP
ncbi:MAG: phosphatidylglycerol lysyltransferase domain-containing protein [Candidatus Omnitrophica bacterium]|nr:phosphatidylglycerol lysyltransferase domain-containing protein [Candidatus Omnitrophota bacterium]